MKNHGADYSSRSCIHLPDEQLVYLLAPLFFTVLPMLHTTCSNIRFNRYYATSIACPAIIMPDSNYMVSACTRVNHKSVAFYFYYLYRHEGFVAGMVAKYALLCTFVEGGLRLACPREKSRVDYSSRCYSTRYSFAIQMNSWSTS